MQSIIQRSNCSEMQTSLKKEKLKEKIIDNKLLTEHIRMSGMSSLIYNKLKGEI
jgi:hypothetical protein